MALAQPGSPLGMVTGWLGVAVERRLWMAYNSFVYSVEMHFLNLFDKFWRLPFFGHTHIADQIWTCASVWLTISINIVLRLPGLLQCSGQCMRKVLAMAKSLTLPWRPWRPWWCDRMECVSCPQKSVVKSSSKSSCGFHGTELPGASKVYQCMREAWHQLQMTMHSPLAWAVWVLQCSTMFYI